MGSVIETTSGGTPSRKNTEFYSNGIIPWVKSKELNGNFINKTEESITELAIKKSAAKLLEKHSVLVAMYGATVGEYGIISIPMACNQAICAILPNTNYHHTYIFEYIRKEKIRIKNMAVGSAQQNISQILIKQLNVHKNINKIKEFHELVLPMFDL